MNYFFFATLLLVIATPTVVSATGNDKVCQTCEQLSEVGRTYVQNLTSNVYVLTLLDIVFPETYCQTSSFCSETYCEDGKALQNCYSCQSFYTATNTFLNLAEIVNLKINDLCTDSGFICTILQGYMMSLMRFFRLYTMDANFCTYTGFCGECL